MDSPPIALPAAIPPARRPPIPLLAAVVPIAGGVVLWLITGSLFALCFAALGPLMLVASLLDGARSRRRDRRLSDDESAQAWARAETDLRDRQNQERIRLRHRHPDAATCLMQPPLRGVQAPDADTELVLGHGVVASGIRTSGGEGDRAREFLARSSALSDAPITVPLGGGVCLRGTAPIVAAAARALVVQLCLRFSPAQLTLAGDLDSSGLGGFPHVRGARRGALRVGVASSGATRPEADAVLWLLPPEAEVPEGVTTVIDCVEPQRAQLRTTRGVQDLAVECLSLAQTEVVAGDCSDRVEEVDVLPDAVSLHDLDQPHSTSGLPAVIGRGERGDVLLDIVDDGPHAIVTGTTGTGKSELLVSWVTAIAAGHGPDRVSFVLADFKGGTAFEPLRELPQVVAVITDLDESGARRGVSSLTAELRRREAVLAAAGARDISEVTMPRLVIVVDEFAALLQEHSDLGSVFTDVAARGRALGMHLILGTQRASGVIREALAANCPLRLSLRVGDPADSRLVLGTDAAAELPGGPGSRGLAFSRRPQDVDPVALRVALTGAADLRAVGMRWSAAATAQSPWLPPLPRLLPLAELTSDGAARQGALVLGRADDPDRQAQPLELLRPGVDRGLAILGGSGAGKSAAIRALAAQHPEALWIPGDPERAWDLVTELAERDPAPGSLVLCDDIDRLLARLPLDHAQQMAQRWEQILRAGSGATVVLTAARAGGLVARLIDALPSRALLQMSSRVEHLAAGGEAAGYDRDRAPGRACIGDREVQFAWIDEQEGVAESRPSRRSGSDAWQPESVITGVVSSGADAVATALRDAYPWCDVVPAASDVQRASRPLIVVGDADAWQRCWTVWQRVRAEGEVLVRAECPTELRQLAGVRELPPYALTHAGRAWSLRDARMPRRVIVPALLPATASNRGVGG
ncbi:FtsK/SpoIIIE domain-containing protein [Microbacterium aurantiacum]|uniref:FtsK/SpoIIIE domain-containing protein n=1 Tax=Microbacterium aurantiacum TaxID=162393 RepID=UPI0015E0A7D4|nr:FtsK/SpoIIIE domain-containing protein [Microbacterium aurantiacum]